MFEDVRVHRLITVIGNAKLSLVWDTTAQRRADVLHTGLPASCRLLLNLTRPKRAG